MGGQVVRWLGGWVVGARFLEGDALVDLAGQLIEFGDERGEWLVGDQGPGVSAAEPEARFQ
jgi:hypothetical protein